MTKESLFIEYVNMFSKLDFTTDIKSSPSCKGNIATFIEWFFETDEWEKLDSQIRTYVDNLDRNSLCFLLADKLYHKTVLLPELSQSQKDVLSFFFEADQEFYNEGELSSFEFVPAQFFPKWLYPINYAFFSDN